MLGGIVEEKRAKPDKPKRMLSKEEVEKIKRRRYEGMRACLYQSHGVREL